MRNAVKKRMQKLDEERRKKQVEELDKKLQMEKAFGIVGTEFKIKYPQGSYIMFTASYNKGEKPKSVSCSWYDKVGGNSKSGKNTVFKPPEWQNITMEEADKIVEMFDDYLYMPLVYV